MAKTFTSASANKHLRSLQDEKDFILETELKSCVYELALGEDADPPKYSYEETRAAVENIDARMLKLRHAVHLFNAHTVLPESGITIDEALVRMAQLNQQKRRLAGLRARSPKERASRYYLGDSNVVEYVYANYDVAQADKDYRAVCEEISRLQLELDLVNQTQTFEVDL